MCRGHPLVVTPAIFVGMFGRCVTDRPYVAPRGVLPMFSGRIGKKTAPKVEIGAEEVYEIVLLLKARCVGGLFFCATAGAYRRRGPDLPPLLANRPVGPHLGRPTPITQELWPI